MGLKKGDVLVEPSKNTPRNDYSPKGRDRPRYRPNAKVQLPWYFYWDGRYDNMKREMSFEEYAKRLVDWCRRFKEDDSEIGWEVLNGLSGEVWKAAHRGGTEVLGEKGGWKVLLQRVEHFLFSTGINRQSELLLTYLQAPARRPREKMVTWLSDFNDHRTRLEAALLVPEGHFISTQFHGFLMLEKSGLPKKERRRVHQAVRSFTHIAVQSYLETF